MRFAKTLALASLTVATAACGTKKTNKQANDATGTDQPAQITDAERQKLDAAFAQLPQAAIVRVPVDAQGNATGAPEMKVVQSGATLTTGDGAQAAFAGGQDPQKIVASKDELDGDTSTQSWSSWNNYQSGYGSVYGGGYGTGYGSGYGTTYGSGYGTTYGSGYGTTYGSGYGTTYGSGYGTGYGSSYGGAYGSSYGGGCGTYCGGWGASYWSNQYKPVLYWQGYGWNYGYHSPLSYTVGNYSYYCYQPYKYW